MLTEEQKEKYKKLDQSKLNEALINACNKGHLDVVKYLLTSDELKEHADIHAYNGSGFKRACEFGHLDVVKYLLTSDELKEHTDIHAENDYGFKHAFWYGHLDVVKYLIFDYNIEKTKEIVVFLKENKHKGSFNIEEMFVARELKNDLSNSLNASKNKNKMKL